MQNHSDMRIPAFLRFVYPIVLRQIREVLRESGNQALPSVKQARAWNTASG